MPVPIPAKDAFKNYRLDMSPSPVNGYEAAIVPYDSAKAVHLAAEIQYILTNAFQVVPSELRKIRNTEEAVRQQFQHFCSVRNVLQRTGSIRKHIWFQHDSHQGMR